MNHPREHEPHNGARSTSPKILQYYGGDRYVSGWTPKDGLPRVNQPTMKAGQKVTVPVELTPAETAHRQQLEKLRGTPLTTAIPQALETTPHLKEFGIQHQVHEVRSDEEKEKLEHDLMRQGYRCAYRHAENIHTFDMYFSRFDIRPTLDAEKPRPVHVVIRPGDIPSATEAADIWYFKPNFESIRPLEMRVEDLLGLQKILLHDPDWKRELLRTAQEDPAALMVLGQVSSTIEDISASAKQLVDEVMGAMK